MKKIVISLLLVLTVAFSAVALSGCGAVTIEILTQSFENLEKEFDGRAEFKDGSVDSFSTDVCIDFGDIETKLTGRAEFDEIKKIYNNALAISKSFIDNYKLTIQNIDEDGLNGEQRKALKALDEAINKNIDEFKTFDKAFDDFALWCASSGSTTEDVFQMNFRAFIRGLGKFVDANIAVSSEIANVLEKINIKEMISRAPIENDTKILNEFLTAKILPVFTTFLIDELHNELNFDGTTVTATKTRISNLITNLKEKYTDFKAKFVTNSVAKRKLTEKEMKEILERSDEFVVEIDDYMKALKGLDIKTLANLKYANDLEKYQKDNKLAEIYLTKLEQFVNISLPNFMNEASSVIYG